MTRVNVTASLRAMLALPLCVIAFGSQSGGASPAMLRVDQSRDNTEAVLAVGQTLEIALLENPTTGFRWELKASAEPICVPRGNTFDRPSAGIGKSGTRRWRFEAIRAGVGRIELVYRRAWEQDKPPAQTFQLAVRVKE